MTATLLDGELLAARIKAEVTDRVARLRGAGVTVGLGTVLVGDDGPSARYVDMKIADCAEVGITSVHEHLPADTTQAELDAVVARLNAKTDADMSKMADDRSNLITGIKGRKAQERKDLFEDGLVNRLIDKGKIKINQDIIRRLIDSGERIIDRKSVV